MSIVANKFNIVSLQVSVFTQSDCKIQQSRFLTAILSNNEHIKVFDGDITSLPVSDDAPHEIPRAIVCSADGRWRLHCGLNRIDCFWNQSREQVNDTDIFSQAVKFILDIVAETKISIGRCALVITRAYTTLLEADKLAAHFCNEEMLKEPIKKSDNFELHNHKKYTFNMAKGGISINSWVRCKTAPLITTKDERMILVEQDINTLQEEIEERKIDNDTLKDFFVSAEREIKEILHKYFPTKGN